MIHMVLFVGNVVGIRVQNDTDVIHVLRVSTTSSITNLMVD